MLQVPVSGWLEAFAAHPRIGDLNSLRQKFGSFAEHSKSEQASAGATDEQLKVWLSDCERKLWPVSSTQAPLMCPPSFCPLMCTLLALSVFDIVRHQRYAVQDLALWNRKYEERFGHIFIICAAGKPATVMLSAVKQRCDPSTAACFKCWLRHATCLHRSPILL